MHSFHTLTQISPQRILDYREYLSYSVRLVKTSTPEDLPYQFSKECKNLYNHPKHLFLQSTEPVYTFILESAFYSTIWIHFRLSSNRLISPLRAPFGGFEGNLNLPKEGYLFLLDSIKKGGLLLGATEIIIKLSPAFHSTDYIDESCFLQSGFSCEGAYNNIHISIDTTPFHEKINNNKLRKLNQCKRSHFTVKEIPVDERLYTFLLHCRTQRDYPISMSYNELEALKSVFPTEIIGVGVFDKDQLVCASVAVRVNRNTLYNFMPASLLEYNAFSPIILLTAYLYQYCQDQKINVLDLGISCNEQGTEKHSLLNFKLQLGGSSLLKVRYHQLLTSS